MEAISKKAWVGLLMPGRGHHNAVPLPRSATKNTKDAKGAKHNVYFGYFVRFVVMLRCTSGALQPPPAAGCVRDAADNSEARF
jgi:hypothetical protein